ncbi:MAG: bifunctional helix-turn-helix domain-containing protein/methylated-DNA--[protein]-cysteine S-methyltransferase [Gammaproteobacteria bacterium]|jgi:AraC family transcriptional regulator of adaptative response/methylated-DNA-[protein]-cysteine methyltransferase
MQCALRQEDYRRIERAIAWMDANFLAHPSIDDVAAVAGLSPAHFSRLFRRWSGLSPARYLNRLRLVRAERDLLDGASVEDAAWEAGLSGPGRLHDLFVTVEAVSPGEFKSGGRGVLLRAGCGDTPFGPAFVARSDRGIVELGFLGERSEREAQADLSRAWPGARIVADEAAGEVLRGIFDGAAGGRVLHVRGTNFQQQVWRALLAVSAGETTDYGRLAAAIGRPGASRAVGNAVGANPVAWLIPCHRVLRRNGELGGYRWGPDRKRAMLAWEHCRLGPETAAV